MTTQEFWACSFDPHTLQWMSKPCSKSKHSKALEKKGLLYDHIAHGVGGLLGRLEVVNSVLVRVSELWSPIPQVSKKCLERSFQREGDFFWDPKVPWCNVWFESCPLLVKPMPLQRVKEEETLAPSSLVKGIVGYAVENYVVAKIFPQGGELSEKSVCI